MYVEGLQLITKYVLLSRKLMDEYNIIAVKTTNLHYLSLFQTDLLQDKFPVS